MTPPTVARDGFPAQVAASDRRSHATRPDCPVGAPVFLYPTVPSMRPSLRHPLRLARTIALGVAALSCSADGVTGPAPIQPAAAPVASLTALPALAISEIMADPSKVADASGEWFEVYNGGSVAVNLKGLKIESGVTATPENHVIATDVIVPAGGYAVLGNNTNASTNGGVTEAYSYGTAITLNNSNTDWVLLKTTGADSATIDSVAYVTRTNGTPATGYSPPSGASRAVVDIALDNTVIFNNANWVTSTATYGLGDKGTPGTGPGGVVTPPGGGGGGSSAPAASISITPRPATASVGGTRQLSVTAKDASGSSTTPPSVTWTSANTMVATINASGLASAGAVGTTLITASAGALQDTVTLTVTDPAAPATISVGVNSPFQIPVGFVKPFFATVKDGTGKTMSPTPKLSWSTTNPVVGSADSLGYLTGLSAGTLRMIATTQNGIADSSFFTIIAADAPTSASYANALELGTPTDADPSDDIIVAHRSYTASYNALRGGPNWVSWNLDASHFGAAPRCDCFSPDHGLPADIYHVADLDYRSGGYDRGHMVQSDSRSTTLQENAATFLMTNILPQAAENNQGPWQDLENYLDTLALRDGKELFIVAGGIYGASPATLKGQGHVAIPDYTWKVAVVLSHGADLSHVTSLDSLRVIAVKMPNLTTTGTPASAVGIRSDKWTKYATTVDEIEAATGYDLLSLLPDNVERPVEANDKPPVARIGGPYAGTEGGLVQLDATASSDPDGDALEYAWSFGDGTTATGATPTHSWADNGSYPVTLTVTDTYGAESRVTTTVTVANAAPVVTLGAGASGLEILSGDAFDAAGAFTDAGIADAPWSWSFAWGSGTPTTGTASAVGSLSASHSYLASGSYMVTLAVTDKDGATGTRAVTVTVRRRPVALDVSPQALEPNEQGNAKLKLVVLSDDAVDATTVDLASVRVGGAGVSVKGNGQLFARTEDVNGDGRADLVLRVDRKELVRSAALADDTQELVLTATLGDGREVEGHGAVRIAGN